MIKYNIILFEEVHLTHTHACYTHTPHIFQAFPYNVYSISNRANQLLLHRGLAVAPPHRQVPPKRTSWMIFWISMMDNGGKCS